LLFIYYMIYKKIYSLLFLMLTLAGSVGFFAVQHYCNSCMHSGSELQLFSVSDSHHHSCKSCEDSGHNCDCHSITKKGQCSSLFFLIPVFSNTSPNTFKNIQLVTSFSIKAFDVSAKLLKEPEPLEIFFNRQKIPIFLTFNSRSITSTGSFRL